MKVITDIVAKNARDLADWEPVVQVITNNMGVLAVVRGDEVLFAIADDEADEWTGELDAHTVAEISRAIARGLE